MVSKHHEEEKGRIPELRLNSRQPLLHETRLSRFLFPLVLETYLPAQCENEEMNGEQTLHYPSLDGKEDHLVRIPAGSVMLDGNLYLPPDTSGIVLFAHGSGSSRHSPRNRFVAQFLHENGLATLLIDLLTTDEEFADRVTGQLRFDIKLLAKRLEDITDWLIQNPETQALKIGYFGASTGAAAALLAAAEHPEGVSAIVSRGGRPDLAGPALIKVRAPTLLLVGGEDGPVIKLNQKALAQLQVEKRLDIIPGATHLFEEPGALEEVASLARQWFEHYLAPAGRSDKGSLRT